VRVPALIAAIGQAAIAVLAVPGFAGPGLAGPVSTAAAPTNVGPPVRLRETTTELSVLGSLSPDFEVAAFDLEELDGERGTELLLIGVAGELTTYAGSRDGTELALVERGRALLPAPDRVLVDVMPSDTVLGSYDVVIAGPSGVSLLRHGRDGFAEPSVLAKRARFRLRTGRPVLADIAQDVNGDGRFDIVLPTATACELWLRAEGDEVSLRRAATVAVDTSLAVSREARNLSNTLWSSLSIPRLSSRDVNGDGREDLLVVVDGRRAFHLQQADGTFPEEPDVDVDLSIFRDTTPEAGLRPGRTLALADDTHYESRDLDGDGVPDYVLAHRRKVWVFHGAKGSGPQFDHPSNVLKAADDVTALVLAELDGDGYPDLLLFKVQVPTIAALIRALFTQWRVEIGAVGYRNQGGASFDTRPKWRGQLELELPSILSIVKDPEAILDRFKVVERSFREAAEGDLDGDGTADVALLAEDDSALEVWFGHGGDAEDLVGDTDALLREVFFEDKDPTWDVDRALGWITSLAARRAERFTAGRAPDARVTLRPFLEFKLVDFVTADLDGDGTDELVLRYSRADGRADGRGATVFDVVGIE